jgi:hypothetical protein
VTTCCARSGLSRAASGAVSGVHRCGPALIWSASGSVRASASFSSAVSNLLLSPTPSMRYQRCLCGRAGVCVDCRRLDGPRGDLPGAACLRTRTGTTPGCRRRRRSVAVRCSLRPKSLVSQPTRRARPSHRKEKAPAFRGFRKVGGTGLEPVTPSLSTRGGRSDPFAAVRSTRVVTGVALRRTEPVRTGTNATCSHCSHWRLDVKKSRAERPYQLLSVSFLHAKTATRRRGLPEPKTAVVDASQNGNGGTPRPH